MGRDDSSSRGRLDVDDRWRMNNSTDRYSYDRRDDQRRGGDSHDARDGEGWTGHGYNDVRYSPSAARRLGRPLHVFSILLRRMLWGGHQHAVEMTVQAATVAHRKTTVIQLVILATMTIGEMIGERRTPESTRGTAVGSLCGRPRGRRVGVMSLRGASLAMVSPPIGRIVLGSRLRRGILPAMKECLAPRPVSGATTQGAKRSQKIRAIRREAAITSSRRLSRISAVGATMIAN
ncbi:hypothetical protein BD310DRAFT_428394 [Dichomitus squalens]|uniref:Uncharacterized protein n=1 Tax=Dichomitus squalens TaxID=114155 RepID=A0A4Q9PWS5_9APHY|nr:hypothetical protein BD310DRAFT_428394 [Dichomitus squalens]